MGKHESRLERERNIYHTMGFVEGLECTKEIITNELKDAIQNGTVVIVKGSDKLFDIINSVGKEQEAPKNETVELSDYVKCKKSPKKQEDMKNGHFGCGDTDSEHRKCNNCSMYYKCDVQKNRSWYKDK